MALKRVFDSAAGIVMGRRWPAAGPAERPPPFPGEAPALGSGFRQLDRATGIKGLPVGRMTELAGAGFRGPASIAAAVAARLQRRQLPVTIIDMAGSFEPLYAVRCGLVAPQLLRHVPANVLRMLNLMEQAARQQGLVIINLGIVPLTLGGAAPARLASLLNRCRKICAASEAVFLYLTTAQTADPFSRANYPPGFPLSEAADIRLWVQDEGWIMHRGQVNGYKGSVTVIKNRLAAGGRGANMRIPFVEPGMARLAEELGF
ncbi:MAG: hypothetical protein ACE5G8_12820 [Anaerolineae bacterium]